MRKYHTIDYVAFGARIATRRKELHLTQQAVAEQLECTESYISRIEHGKAQPTLDFIALLAATLGVGVDCFLPQTKAGTYTIGLELQEKWKSCSPELLLFLNRVTDAAKEFEKSIRSQNRTE